jgi:hypothetical protein
MSFFSYCEFLISLCIHFPTFLASTLLTLSAESDHVDRALSQLDNDLKFLIKRNSTDIYMNRAVVIGLILMASKYLQQRDVI